MSTGLPVSRLVNVSVALTPLGAQVANFNSLLIVGDTNIINVKERLRSYSSLSAVSADGFGNTTPEYLAAQNFFSQVPAPTQLYLGRWAQSATAGLLIGGNLTVAEQAMSVWNAINNGSFKIAVDGEAATAVTGLDFSAAANLNAVAADIQAGVRALAGSFANVSCVWTGAHFLFRCGTTGPASAVAALITDVAVGTDISALLLCTTSTLASLVAGIAAETALQAVQALDALSTQWYALMFASVHIVDADHLAIAAYVEADAGNPHVYGLTTSEAAALTGNDSTSIGYQLKQLGYNRTLYQFSSSSPYAVASLFGRGVTVDFSGNNTVITFAFKNEPGVTAENLTASQADALDKNNYNYFAAFDNNTSIIVNGKMASGVFTDEIWDVDWLANSVQTAMYNALYTSPTKIPQTDAGMHILATAAAGALQQGVANGTLGPGVWNAAGFGTLAQGDWLSAGYYIFQPPVATQSPTDRTARKSVLFQIAAKLAIAVQSANVVINVNP